VQSALTKERKRANELAAQLKGFEVDGKLLDMNAVTDMGKELEDLRAQKQLLGKKDEELKTALEAQFRKEYTGQLEGLTKKLTATDAARKEAEGQRDAASGKLKRYRIETALQDAAVAARVRPEFLDDVKRRADEFTLLDDADEPDPLKQVVMLGADGQPRTHLTGPKSGQFIYASDFLETASTAKPLWFESSSGGGGGGGNRNAPKGTISLNDKQSFSDNLEKIAKGQVEVAS
jgi:uncharacterized protein YjbJ (UPF0337 family)